MTLVLASRNKHKIAELQALLSEYIEGVQILSLDEVGMTEDIEENGETYEENAMIKARAAAKFGYIGVGDDSGLSVRALGGAPGVYSARYAGGHGNTEENNRKLLRELADKTDRFAEFVCVIGCVMPDGKEFCVQGRCPGTILREADGEGGFGYDPLFYYEEAGKTFAGLSPEEKNAVSHRGRAVKAFAETLKKYETK